MTVRILKGDCREVLRELEPESVHCVVTSPPYWGLRDYGVAPSVWGGDVACDHEWSTSTHSAGGGQPGEKVRWNHTGAGPSGHPKVTTGLCLRCGAWAGAHGLEPTFDLFVANEVHIFREVRRVLRTDGTLWLNLGDSYATGAGKVGERPGGGAQGDTWAGYRGDRNGHEGKHAYMGERGIGPMTSPNRMPQEGLKAKDLCGIP